MKILPTDFKVYKYGLYARFVETTDAQFIVDLRTNPKLSKFIHATSSDVNDQIEWIKKYKEREKCGEEYYFYFSKFDKPVGVIRISNIHPSYATLGSWLCVQDSEPDASIATIVLARDILFDELQVERDLFNVDKANKHVVRLHKQMGAKIVSENEREYHFELTAVEYFENKNVICNFLNLG